MWREPGRRIDFGGVRGEIQDDNKGMSILVKVLMES